MPAYGSNERARNGRSALLLRLRSRGGMLLLMALHHAMAVFHHPAHLLHHAHHLGHAALIAGWLLVLRLMHPFVLCDRVASGQRTADNEQRDCNGDDTEPVHEFLLGTRVDGPAYCSDGKRRMIWVMRL